MTDAEYEAQKARVMALWHRWQDGPLWLPRWRVVHRFHQDWLEDDEGNPDTQATARTRTQWEYMQATVDWNLPQVAKEDDEELEIIFVHELMHIYVAEISPKGGPASKGEERVVTQLACAFRETWAAATKAAQPDPLAWNG